MTQNWEFKKLGEVCENLDAQRKPVTRKNRVPGEVPYYGATGIVDHVNDYLFNEKLVLLGEDGAKWNAGNECAFIINGKTWVNNHAHVLKPNREIISDEWLAYYLNFRDLTPFISGMTVPKLTQSRMNDIEIPVPSISQQKNIVERLDEVFKGIAKIKNNLEKNVANAEEVFESNLSSVFINKEEDWIESSLKDIGEIQTGITPSTSNKGNTGNYIPFIKPAAIDVDGNGSLNYEDEGLSETGLKNGRLIKSGSIVMVCIGATIGKVGFANRDISCNQQINALTVARDFYPKFFYYALRNKEFLHKVISKASQATLPIINKRKWESLTVHYPTSYQGQKDIADKLDEVSINIRKLIAAYQKKLDSLAELKQGILQKAFSDNLNNQLNVRSHFQT